MDLNIYDIIKGPVTSDKAFLLNKKFNKLVLKVHPQANKIQIKQSLERMFSVKIKKVNVLRRKGKTRVVRRVEKQRPLSKHAIVTLAKGYKLDLFDQAGAGIVKPQKTVKTG